MVFQNAEHKTSLIQIVVAKINQTIADKEQARLVSEFFQQFYTTVAYEDLEHRSAEDLYSAALTFWNFISQRPHAKTKVRVYNPDYEKHGWQSTHTIIEIAHDDMPFLVDSIRMEINRQNLTIHLMIHLGGMKVRRKQQKIVEILPFSSQCQEGVTGEAPIYIEIDRQTDSETLSDIKSNIERVLADVRATVTDWHKMRNKVTESITELGQVKHIDSKELAESKDFLCWIEDNHFTFLGMRDYELITHAGEQVLQVIPETGLGVLKGRASKQKAHSLMLMPPEARKIALSDQILFISKTNTCSSVHRPTYTDYIGIKRFNLKGQIIGERRIIGLYTSAAYNTNPKHIPFLRRKVANIMAKAHVNPISHAGKELLNIIDTLPRDDLFQGSVDELLELVVGIFHIQERRQIRLFVRKDIYGRFISCLVYVPRDLYNTKLHNDMQQVLQAAFKATTISYSTRFSDSILARIRFVIRIDTTQPLKYDVKDIERKLIKIGRSWEDELSTLLHATFGEEQANRLITKYVHAFPVSYREDFSARSAVNDIKYIKLLSDTNTLEINFYLPANAIEGQLRFKVYQLGQIIPLSDVLPILENMGLRVISEYPYEIGIQGGKSAWVNDFGLEYIGKVKINFDDIEELLEDAFEQVWFGKASNDSLNKLVASVGLSWREVAILRAYAKYLKQIRFTFSKSYIEYTLNHQHAISKDLVKLFLLRFEPMSLKKRKVKINILETELLHAMELVVSLEEDRILKRYLELIKATLRTNYFQKTESGQAKPYLAFKFDPSLIQGMSTPIMQYEVFVYAPRFEGIHLREGKVARGGIRWSDRTEDFYREIKDLVGAQGVKNAVIGPAGAKGGFVPMKIPDHANRETIMAEGIACYQDFISGLLDLTDNLKGSEVIKPLNTRCYDDDDPYLVVAADKGTAAFSDIANEIAKQYKFWLGDAFASGGTTGYDHKKMGITARGAWESVKRHFRELGRDIQTTEFSVVGIGDMSGDVFGNGMLLSKYTKLVAAFNHLEILIDPDPNIKISYAERLRLSKLPRSSWDDYDPKLISKGGGVFKRSAKSIRLTPEIKQLLAIKKDAVIPSELIQAIIKAPVDLLFCGGIGTYIKSSLETNADVGDKMNDNNRVNANEIRCKVVGEGANLGFTQLARIECSLTGVHIYSDFIDNSGGVDCSDHEVNIKILLDTIVRNGDMTIKQRNRLLADMTDEVARLVLHNNYKQSQAISLSIGQASQDVELYQRYVHELKQKGIIKDSSVFLPNQGALMSQETVSHRLTKPALAMLLSYTKILIKEEILSSDVPEDPYLSNALMLAFPPILWEKFRIQMEGHSLRREIIATQVSNTLVNEMGLTFAYRLSDQTGELIPSIVRAYTIVRTIYGMGELWQAIESLDNKVTAQSQIEVMTRLIHLLRRMTHWLLRNRRGHLDIVKEVNYFTEGISELKSCLPKVLKDEAKDFYRQKVEECTERGIPVKLANEIAATRYLFFSLDIVEVAEQLNLTISEVATLYFAVGGYLEFDWLRFKIIEHPTTNHWETLAQEALRDDMIRQQRLIVTTILKHHTKVKSVQQRIELWAEQYQSHIERWRSTIASLRAAKTVSFTMFFVATRMLLDLAQSSLQGTNYRITNTSEESSST